MRLLAVMLLLAAFLDWSLGQDEEEEEDEEELPASGVSPKVQQEIVDKINELRRTVKPTARNMLKVIWNETVAENAKTWADECIPHSASLELWTIDGMQCGQTISQSDSFSTWAEIVDYWKDNGESFTYGVGRTNPRVNTHSYTQAIWYNSFMVGCGTSHCPNNKFSFLYICQYCPAGNIVGLIPMPYAKGPPCGDCPNHCEDKLCTNYCRYVDRTEDCDHMKSMMGCKRANKDGLCNATCREYSIFLCYTSEDASHSYWRNIRSYNAQITAIQPGKSTAANDL